MLTTPFGSPALAANSANFSAVSGVTWKHRSFILVNMLCRRRRCERALVVDADLLRSALQRRRKSETITHT